MKKIKNLTPHTVKLIMCPAWLEYGDELIVEFPPEEVSARVNVQHIAAGYVKVYGVSEKSGADGTVDVPIKISRFGAVEGLPDYEEGTLYIVSRLVKQAVPDRTDCIVPDGIIRNDKGVILGCCRFSL
jgi:hypothetical protein